MSRTTLALVATILLASLRPVQAQPAAGDAPLPNRGIRNLITKLETGFNQGDAAQLAACWTASGDLIAPTGERITGRDNIEKAFRKALATRKDSKLRFHVLASRVANDGLALIEGGAEVTPKPPVVGERRFSLVLVKQGEDWRIESARETVIRETAEGNPLNDLGWLVGQWTQDAAAGSDIRLQSACDWTENHAFLIRKFKVEGKAVLLRGGTEIIGWDPRTQQIRSWVFETDGGFGENVWLRDGNRWLVKFSGTLADGTQVSATNIVNKVDASTVKMESIDRVAGGQRQADIPPLMLKRQADEPTKASPSGDGAKASAHVLP